MAIWTSGALDLRSPLSSALSARKVLNFIATPVSKTFVFNARRNMLSIWILSTMTWQFTGRGSATFQNKCIVKHTRNRSVKNTVSVVTYLCVFIVENTGNTKQLISEQLMKIKKNNLKKSYTTSGVIQFITELSYLRNWSLWTWKRRVIPVIKNSPTFYPRWQWSLKG